MTIAPSGPDIAGPDPLLKSGLGFAEFVTLSAALTAIAAMSIDIMLPALPAIGADLGVSHDNDRQLVIVVFTLAFAACQLVFGPLSDRFGRRPLILAGCLIFVIASLGAAFSTDFTMLLAFRMLQGVGTAALRVVALAVVRDCFAGPSMGRVMAISFSVFMIVPILAPLGGQLIVIASDWRMIFGLLAAAGAGLALWSALRLNETLDAADRRSIDLSGLWFAFREVVTNRIALGYSIAMTLTSVALFSYIVTSQQIYGELYGLGEYFPVIFGLTSLGMAITSIAGTGVVSRIGMRPVIHGGLAVMGLSGAVLVGFALFGTPPLLVTFLTVTVAMIAFGILSAQSAALAMEPLGHVAGMASALMGVFTTSVGAIGGGMIGAAYDGSVMPMALGYGLAGGVSLLVLLVTERGRLFVN